MNDGDDTLVGGGLSEATPPLFVEVQRFKQWVFWVPVLAVIGVVWWQFLQQVVIGRPQGEEPIPDVLAWVFTLLFGVGLPIFVWQVRLITEVRPGTILVRLAPFRALNIATDQIQEGAVRRYSAFREYGGWGVKMSRLNGRAYNAYGDQGVQLLLTGGNLVLIGSQRSEELLAAIRTAGADLRRVDKEGRRAGEDEFEDSEG